MTWRIFSGLLRGAQLRSDRLDRCDATRCATRLGLICLSRRLVGAHDPAAHGPDRSRPSATARDNAPSGQLVGSWTRMRAIRSITRALSDRRELGAGEWTRLGNRSTHAEHQPERPSVENEAYLIGRRAVARHAVQGELRLVQLDQVLHLPALTRRAELSSEVTT
jgi:hypothetical protein